MLHELKARKNTVHWGYFDADLAPALRVRSGDLVPPGSHGGNIDNWRIGSGTTMFYPVAVDGALFSVGDPHISQGDGEINGTAIEASLDVLLQIVLRKDFRLPSPLLETHDDPRAIFPKRTC